MTELSPLEKVQARRKQIARVERQRKIHEKRDKVAELPHDIIFDELDQQRGNLLKTAEALSVPYPQLVGYVDQHDDLKQLLILSREKLIDKAERVLDQHLDNGSLRATMFTLKTIGKNRGYYEKKELADVSPASDKAKLKVDLTKLSSEQLIALKDIMVSANQPDDANIIDVTPDSVVGD